MKKVVHIVGARPQFIKLAPLLHHSRGMFENSILHTGQHYDNNMSGSFFEELEIPQPDFNLGIGSAGQGEQTAAMLAGIEKILLQEKPDAVVVYGDTNSTLAGALAAAKLNILTVHIEAGLRSFNRTMPEEINRICADHICNLLFAPTKTAVNNLENEGLTLKSHFVGDIMTDSLEMGLRKLSEATHPLEEYNLSANDYYLLTLHRPYTVDDPETLLDLLMKLNALDLKVVFPIHPRTANIMKPFPKNTLNNIQLVAPQPYLQFISLMKNANKIITDSGGVQKEAYILKKLCVTLRPETEWTETVESGWNTLISPLREDLVRVITAVQIPSTHAPIFGYEVSRKIVNILSEALR